MLSNGLKNAEKMVVEKKKTTTVFMKSNFHWFLCHIMESSYDNTAYVMHNKMLEFSQYGNRLARDATKLFP